MTTAIWLSIYVAGVVLFVVVVAMWADIDSDHAALLALVWPAILAMFLAFAPIGMLMLLHEKLSKTQSRGLHD